MCCTIWSLSIFRRIYLEAWVCENRQVGIFVSAHNIRTEALKWAKKNPDHCQNFSDTKNWCSRFMEGKNFVLRQKNKIAQKLPADLEDKITNFHKYIIGLRKKYNYPLNQIGNMDETPCFLIC